MTNVNSHKKNNFTMIDNDLIDALSKTNLTAYETRVLFAIIRHSIGWNKEEATLTYRYLESYCRIRRYHIARAVKSLLNKQIISKNDNKYKIQDFTKWNVQFKSDITNSYSTETTNSCSTETTNTTNSCSTETFNSYSTETFNSCPTETNYSTINHSCSTETTNSCSTETNYSTTLGNKVLPNQVTSITYSGNKVLPNQVTSITYSGNKVLPNQVTSITYSGNKVLPNQVTQTVEKSNNFNEFRDAKYNNKYNIIKYLSKYNNKYNISDYCKETSGNKKSLSSISEERENEERLFKNKKEEYFQSTSEDFLTEQLTEFQLTEQLTEKFFQLREKLIRKFREYFPAIDVPINIPNERIDYFIYLIETNKINPDVIQNPVRYMQSNKLIIESFPSLAEREAEKRRIEKLRLEEIKRQREEFERYRKEHGEEMKQKIRGFIEELERKYPSDNNLEALRAKARKILMEQDKKSSF